MSLRLTLAKPSVAVRAAPVQARRTVAVRAVADADLYSEFEKLIDEFSVAYKSGDRVTGNVIKVDNRGAWVDVGGKSPGFVPADELSVTPVVDASAIVQIGSSREFVVLGQNNQQVQLSIRKLELEVVWQRLRQYQSEDVTIEGTIFNSNRGGVMVDVHGVRGFVPMSQLGPQYNKDECAGITIPLKIIEADEAAGKLVLSNKRVEGQGAAEAVERAPGDVVEGTVISVKPYGAFIDLGGSSGLLHISQMSSERITNINNVVASGDKIKVMVLGLDKEKDRYALSTKKLEPAPGDFIRNPDQVFARAEEMAAQFKERIAATDSQE